MTQRFLNLWNMMLSGNMPEPNGSKTPHNLHIFKFLSSSLSVSPWCFVLFSQWGLIKCLNRWRWVHEHYGHSNNWSTSVSMSFCPPCLLSRLLIAAVMEAGHRLLSNTKTLLRSSQVQRQRQLVRTAGAEMANMWFLWNQKLFWPT